MKQIYVATKVRGFLTSLFVQDFEGYEFVFNNNKSYETNSSIKLKLHEIAKSSLADYLGLIQQIKVPNKSLDLAFSYNRFLKTNKPYIIYLENPFALMHYSINRNKSFLGKRKMKALFSNPHLKAIICLSRACFDTVNTIYHIPDHIKVLQIYPFVEKNPYTTSEGLTVKSYADDINCLYISSNFRLKGGQEIIEVFTKFRELGIENVKLTIITEIDKLVGRDYKRIKENPNIELFNFEFNKQELNEIYNKSSIYLNPTRQDSFSLVVLEAMKSGNAIITSDLYALPEMVKENQNGYYVRPKHRFFNYDNMPNPQVWNDRDSTIYSDFIDDNIVRELFNKINFLNENRNVLDRFSQKSFNLSNEKTFNEESILNAWESLFEEITN